ncbi:restriction system protein [Laceyella sacchari]|uniref:restriction endonuclease n=1 Tax=Laceyella sacchari TaxID=37482 RepID=UPI0010EE8C16|nr:restriction endonuclease [Laceyella sacchari]TCW40966.1 restriction system protein [Laceyella sacchari]
MIPDYQTLMLPVLKYLSNGKEHTTKDLREAMATKFKITTKERKQLLPSGRQPVFDSRVGWACTYLKKAKLIESPKRGIIKITYRGRKVLNSHPSDINNQFLLQFEEFRGFFAKGKADSAIEKTQTKELVKPPRETLSESYELIRKELAEELLEQVMKCSPDFFEDLVVKLLVAMGYGGSLADAGQRVGGTGDGGIDGIIKEDKLGLSQIYIQGKRWDKPVGSPEIQQFAGALTAKNAEKGVFITTSRFTASAISFAEKVPKNIVLIDGDNLAELMIDYNIEVSEEERYIVKRIDSDFFEQ